MARVLVLALLALATAAVPARAGEWVAGDLHVHSTYSHDSYGGLTDDNTGHEEAYVLGFPVLGDFSLAASRGLDFLAITDHNDVRSQSDPGFGAFGVIGLPGYENSLSGHAQMLGARRVYEKGDTDSAADVEALANALRADGGAFQINHPADSTTDDPDDLDWKLGYAVQPDTVEAWNSSRLYQPPFPSSNSHDDAIRYWQGWLDRGARVALTGGSDSHWISTSAAQGPGQPTTWVNVRERSVAGILEGLRAGRTSVSHQPPAMGGPRIVLEADPRGDRSWSAIQGDAVPPGTPLRVRVRGGAGTRLKLYRDGGEAVGKPIPVSSRRFVRRFTVPAGTTWVRAEIGARDALAQREAICEAGVPAGSYCRNRLLVFAMTSALYLRP